MKKRLLAPLLLFLLATSSAHSQPSPPNLLIDFITGSQGRLSWTNTPGNIVLEGTDTLTPTSIWQTFPQNPTLANGQFSVLVDVTGISRFFRLRIIQPDGS